MLSAASRRRFRIAWVAATAIATHPKAKMKSASSGRSTIAPLSSVTAESFTLRKVKSVHDSMFSTFNPLCYERGRKWNSILMFFDLVSR